LATGLVAETKTGKSLATLWKKALNEERVSSPRDGSWCASTLRGNAKPHEVIIRNRLYIGIASVCK
jgi:site-specific DNA recombinase